MGSASTGELTSIESLVRVIQIKRGIANDRGSGEQSISLWWLSGALETSRIMSLSSTCRAERLASYEVGRSGANGTSWFRFTKGGSTLGTILGI